MSTRVNSVRNRLFASAATALLGVLAFAATTGCRSSSDAAASPLHTAMVTSAPNASGTGAVEQSSSEQAHPAFDAEKAFALLKEQCDFGVRPLGSEAHEKTRDYLLKEMKKYADDTVTQTFQYHGLPVTNVLGIFYPDGSKSPSQHPILLLAHWDTRPIADGPFSSEIRKGAFRYGPKGWNRTTPIMGADDAASGVAVLLELARIFKEKHPPVGVVMLLDDGEDYGDFQANEGEGDGIELGSRYFAKHFRENKLFGEPEFGILLDMVGGKDIIIPRESYSQRMAPGTNEKVFGVAQSLGYSAVFMSNATQDVGDDHLALNQNGIPTIDLIHPLPYGEYATSGYVYWHTLQDTVDKCSPRSLKAVGDTVAEVLYRESPN